MFKLISIFLSSLLSCSIALALSFSDNNLQQKLVIVNAYGLIDNYSLDEIFKKTKDRLESVKLTVKDGFSFNLGVGNYNSGNLPLQTTVAAMEIHLINPDFSLESVVEELEFDSLSSAKDSCKTLEASTKENLGDNYLAGFFLVREQSSLWYKDYFCSYGYTFLLEQ